MNRWLFLWRRLTRELWVRASAYALVGVGAALLAAAGDGHVPADLADRFGGESVEEILTILASSLLAVATFSVGAMVTAYTSVGTEATPRVSHLVTSDSQTQKALSTFVGAFLYAVVSVTAINASYYGPGGRAILFLGGLAVVGLVAFRLLAWINALARLARVGHMIDLVERETGRALRTRCAAPYLGGGPGELASGVEIAADRTGYVGNVDSERLQKLAAAGDFMIQILATPGAFVRRDEPLARIDRDRPDEALCDDIRAGFTVADSRTFEQDPRFGLIVLGEIAGKALSPGVNDPGTAIQVVGAAVRLLDDWARPLAGAEVETSCTHLLAPPLYAADLVDDVFGPVARYGAADLAVAIRLQKALGSLAAVEGELGRAAQDAARIALSRSKKAMTLAEDFSRVRNAAAN